MSFLQGLIDKGKGLLDSFRQEPRPASTETIIRTSFDREDWDAARTAIPAIAETADTLGEKVDYVDDFLADLHAAFLKQEPLLRDASEVVPSHLANREVMAQLMELPEMAALRQHSRGDKYSAAMAMLAMETTVSEALHRAQSAADEAEQERQKQEAERQRAADDLAEAMAQAEAGGGDPADLQAAIDALAGAPVPSPVATQQAAQQAAQSMIAAMGRKAQEAVDDLDEEAAMMAGYGQDPAALEKMSVEERLELAQRVRGSRLSAFAALLGQFKRVQRAAYRTKVKDNASESHDVKLSNDFTRIVSAEYLAMADPMLELLQLKRFTQHALVTRDVRGRERQGRGPIIVVGDESSSMAQEYVAGGSREAWAKAFSLALLDQAAREKRDFVYIGFSSKGSTRVVEFPEGKAPLDKVFELTEGFLKGGTYYEEPLLMALAHIKARGDKPRPDIVFITDDEYRGELPATFMREWNATKDRWSLKCYGIAIGCNMSGSLAAVSDNVRSVTSMVESDPAAMADIFRTI